MANAPNFSQKHKLADFENARNQIEQSKKPEILLYEVDHETWLRSNVAENLN